ncbi:hypothetical protein OAA53_01230 [Salibacteraceae bacterium]|nr:hypothetical protein [Flavobacteriales bacterium]MDB9701334.1 hypothetical protein [Salibacteraceae bacterium]
MELAETIIEAFAFLIAVAAVLAVIYLIVMKYFDSKRGDLERALHQEKMKQFLPIQMQAYERLILFLERIHPERLVFRVNKPGMSARIMQAEILKLVRDEFDHNLAQQLYISNEAWVAVCTAREESMKILTFAAEKTDATGTSLDFSSNILSTMEKLEKSPTEMAAKILKAEFSRSLKSAEPKANRAV